MGLIRQEFRATQLLYRSTDRNGAPEATVTTVLVPAERGPETVCPVVSNQCAIDAVASRCFPSYALRRGAFAVGALAQFEFLLIAAALAEGWAVTVPDHEGTHGMWVRPTSRATESSTASAPRSATSGWACRRRRPSDCGATPAADWCSAWSPRWRPATRPSSTSSAPRSGSPVGDLGSTFRRLNGSLYSGLPAMVVAALSHVYPELDRVIQRHATDEGRALLKSLEKMTTAEAVLRMVHKDMGSYVDRPLDEILDEPEIQFVFEDIRLGTAAPTTPVLIVQAVHDRIISVDDIDELAETYRAGGAAVTYHRDMFSEHTLLHPMSAPMTLRWLRDRFGGPAAIRAPGPDDVADAAQPVDLQGNGAAREDRGQGDYRPKG